MGNARRSIAQHQPPPQLHQMVAGPTTVPFVSTLWELTARSATLPALNVRRRIGSSQMHRRLVAGPTMALSACTWWELTAYSATLPALNARRSIAQHQMVAGPTTVPFVSTLWELQLAVL